MAVTGTFSGNTSSDWFGPVNGDTMVAVEIVDGDVDLEYRVSGGTAYVGASWDETTSMPQVLESHSTAIEYRLTRRNHSTAAPYYLGSD